jgi:hypothetical protein
MATLGGDTITIIIIHIMIMVGTIITIITIIVISIVIMHAPTIVFTTTTCHIRTGIVEAA